MALRKRRQGLVYPVREDWHYVGEAGEPAFGTNWANAASDRNLAFRIRETGVVDIQGYVENTAAPSTPGLSLFTLPAASRPSADTFQGSAVIQTDDGGDPYCTAPVSVTTAGTVVIQGGNDDPIKGAVGVALYVWIQGLFYLNPADAP